jgi:sugar lactone lactonase YvrE
MKNLILASTFLMAAGCAGSVTEQQLGTPAATESRPAAKQSVIYVASLLANSVPVFNAQGNLIRTITNGVKEPNSLALDTKNRLYVTNIGANTVTVYANQGKKLSKTISEDVKKPRRVVVDSSGIVYVTMKRFLEAYPPSPKQAYRMQPPSNGPTALDQNDSLYVADGSRVNVYAPGAKHPTRTIASDIGLAGALAFDAQGNLYVADDDQPGSGPCGSRIEEFAAGGDTLLNTVSNGICAPQSLAFDSDQNLYVANGAGSGNGSVAVYAADSFALMYQLTDDISGPTSVAIDASNNLYVASPGINKIPVYQQGAKSPFLELKSGIDEPTQVLIQP